MSGRVRAVGWSMDQDQVDVIAKPPERGVNAHGRWYRWALYLFRYDGVGPAFELAPFTEREAAMWWLTAGCPLGVTGPAGGPDPVTWEVPWRDETRSRSARRSEPVRILSPRQLLPDVEVMSAPLAAQWETVPGNPERVMVWNLSASAYFAPRTTARSPFPFTRVRCGPPLRGPN
jgi:hypothetical protein